MRSASAYGFLAVMVLIVSSVNVQAKNKAGKLQLVVSEDGTHFQYWIARPAKVRRAWIDVLDVPTVLDSKAVAIQQSGKFDWEWNHSAFNGYENEDDILTLSLWDPDGETLICEGTVMSAHPGGVVSQVTLGGRTKFSPEPRLGTSLERVVQGSPSFSFDVVGADLTPDTVLHVFANKGAKCTDRQVHTEVHDLSHARVTIDRECLWEPGILSLSPEVNPPSYEDSRAWIYVASRTSPTLKSVSASELRADMMDSQLQLTVRGKGFNEHSQVYAGHSPHDVFYGLDQVVLNTEYVSPTELRAQADPSYGDDPLDKSTHGGLDPLHIWVEGDEKRFELSESRDLQVKPLPARRLRPTAVITSVSPYPVRLMNEHSREELKLTIHGEHFIPANKAVTGWGHSAENERRLRTEFVSPTTLHAWIPREYWRRHHIVYRLTIETTSGRQYMSKVEPKGDN
jgi:hypothetical protein